MNKVLTVVRYAFVSLFSFLFVGSALAAAGDVISINVFQEGTAISQDQQTLVSEDVKIPSDAWLTLGQPGGGNKTVEGNTGFNLANRSKITLPNSVKATIHSEAGSNWADFKHNGADGYGDNPEYAYLSCWGSNRDRTCIIGWFKLENIPFDNYDVILYFQGGTSMKDGSRGNIKVEGSAPAGFDPIRVTSGNSSFTASNYYKPDADGVLSVDTGLTGSEVDSNLDTDVITQASLWGQRAQSTAAYGVNATIVKNCSGTFEIHYWARTAGIAAVQIVDASLDPVQMMVFGEMTWAELLEFNEITGLPDGTPVILNVMGEDSKLVLESALTCGSITVDDGEDLSVICSDSTAIASLGKFRVGEKYPGSLIFDFDATSGFEADSTLLDAIKNITGNAKFVFRGEGENGATLSFGTNVKTLHTHIVFDGGKHSMTWQSGNNLFAADATDDNPTILVKGETTLDFNAKDISGWSGGVEIGGVIRVNDGGILNLLQIGNNTMFYRQRLWLDPGALVTFTCNNADNGESRFRWHGGAVKGKEQIYVPASAEDAIDKVATIRQLGDGGFLLASDNTRGCAMFVGKNSKLVFDCDFKELDSNNAIMAKYGEGEFEIAAERTIAADFNAQEGIISLVNEPIFRNFTASDKVTYRFPEGTAKDAAVGLCSGTLTAPGRVMDAKVYVGNEPVEGISLIYDAAMKTVAYADALSAIEIDKSEVGVSDINVAYDSGYGSEVKVKLTGEGTVAFKIDGELNSNIEAIYLEHDGKLLLDLDEEYWDEIYKYDLTGVTGQIKYAWLKYADAKVIAVNFNRKGFDNTDANGSDDNIIADDEDSGALECNLLGKGWLQVDGKTSDWTSDAFVFDTAIDEKVASGDLQVKWSSNNNFRWSSDSVTKFLRGYLDDGGNHAQFYAKNIPFAFYDVIVYFATDSGNYAFSPVTVNGTSYCWDGEKTAVGTSKWGESHSTDARFGVNALCIEKCWGDLTVIGGANANTARGGIAAIVIVENKDVKKQTIATSSIGEANGNVDAGADVVVIEPENGVLVVDAAPAIDYVVSGTGALKLQDSPAHSLTAEDLAKLQFSGFDKVVWDSSWVNGEACLYDWTFDNNGKGDNGLASVGKNKNALSWDTGYSADNGFVTDAEAFIYGTALKTQATPYSSFGVNYPTAWTCAVAGIVPDVANGALITFGTKAGGLIGLIAGDSENEVKIVRTTGDSHYLELAKMEVPNARTASHTYVFVKTESEITVYLDGSLWNETKVSGATFGASLQIGSVHGNTGSTGIVQVKSAPDGTAIQAVRIYDKVLGEKAIAALSAEFPYNSPAGSYSRVFTEAAGNTWTSTGAWSDADGNLVDMPEDGAAVTITSDVVDTELLIDVTATTESLTVNGEGSFVISANNGNRISNPGATFVNAPLTIAGSALTIKGGPTKIGENGSIKFDYSTTDLAAYAGGYLQLTGMIDRNDAKVTCDLVEDATYYTASFGYDTVSSTYRITVVAKERTEGKEIAIADVSETVNLTDTTPFVDVDGNSIPRIAADTIILDSDALKTLNVNAALTVPLSEIKTKQDLAINFGNVNGLTNIEVVAGTLRTSAGYTGKIVIDEGATYDVDSKDNWTAEFVMNGGTLANTGDPTVYDHVQVYKIDFEADSTINAASAIMSIASGWNEFDYNLNGKTLTKTGEGEYLVSKGKFVGGGAVVVNEGVFTLDAFTIPAETTLMVTVPNGATFAVKDDKNHGFAKDGSLQFYGVDATVDIQKSVTFDTFSIMGEPTIKLADGAALTATTFAYNNESFTLDLSAMTLGSDPITLITAAGIDTGDITLVLPEGVEEGDYALNYTDGVLTLVKQQPDWPGDWPEADDDVKTAFAAWTTAYGVTDFTGKEDAFLLNVDPEEALPAFKIESIEVEGSVATVVISIEGKDFETETINGKLFVEAGDELEGMTDQAFDFDVVEGKATGSIEAKFIKAKVGFKAPAAE